MIQYKLHFIRHGQTQGNLEGRYVGSTDLPLCPQGEESLQKMLEEFTYPWVDVVFVSPLSRCRQTAELLYPHRPHVVVENLREMDFGDFEGRLMSELATDEAFLNWVKHSHVSPPPGGEGGTAFGERLEEGMHQMLAYMMNERITDAAVVTHGGVIMTMLAQFGLPQAEMGHWATDNGKGYTALANTQLWTREKKFEIFAQLPMERLPEEEDER